MNFQSTFCGAAALAVGLAALGAPAFAQTLTLSSTDNYFGSVTLSGDGTVEYDGQSYDSVLQQDKLYSDFSATGLPKGTPVTFQFSTIGGTDYHSITFTADYSSISPVSWSYNIELQLLPGETPKSIEIIADDLTQSAGLGVANVTTHAHDINGDDYNIIFTKTGSAVTSGATDTNTNSDDFNMYVTNTITAGVGGTNASALENSFTQVTIPEPSTWAMMGLGFAGLGFAAFKRRKLSAA